MIRISTLALLLALVLVANARTFKSEEEEHQLNLLEQGVN